MLRRLYDWMMRRAHHPKALWVLAAIAFAESSFFPVPPDVMLVPMSLSNRRKAFTFASVCTLASVAGGMLGYFIGYTLYETIGSAIVDFYGLQASMDDFKAGFAKWGLWIILLKGLTPIPYKVVTILSGVAGYNFTLFVMASIATRGLRFFLLATLLYFYGTPVRDFIERRLTLVTTLFALVIVGGIVAVKYIL